MKYLPYLLLILLVSSCGSKPSIRELALEHEALSEYDFIINAYRKCYYKLPESIEAITDYLRADKKLNPIDYSVVYVHNGVDIVDLIERSGAEMEYYEDSIFLYDKTLKCGCVIRGTPFYWFHHKDAWPERYTYDDGRTFLFGYWELFHPRAYDSNGELLWEKDMGEIYRKLPGQSSYYCMWEDICNVIVCYSEDTGMRVEYNDAAVYEAVIDSDWESIIRQYLQENPEIKSIILPAKVAIKQNDTEQVSQQ